MMENWRALLIVLNVGWSTLCMQPYIDPKLLNRKEKYNLRLLRIANDACKQNPSHFSNYVPCRSPYTPLDLARTNPVFSPLEKELIQQSKKRKTFPLQSSTKSDGEKTMSAFDSYRHTALLFYLDACRANPAHLNTIMPFSIPDVPLGISASNDIFLPITKEFLQLGARPNMFNHHIGGHAPLFKAIQHNARKTISYLIRHGALLFFMRKTKTSSTRILYGNTIDPKELWAKDRTALVYAHQQFALRMLLLCRLKEGCILQYAPKDVLKMIVERIT